jgi:YD repeat-containing protein
MSPSRVVPILLLSLTICFFLPICTAQVPTGVPQFGSFQNGPVDTVNLATLNVHFEIPIRSTPGSKLPFSAVLAEESSHYYPHYAGGWYWYNSFSSPPVSWFFDQWPIRTLLPMGIPTGNSVTVKTCGAFSPWGGSVGSISISNDVLTVTGGYDNFTVGEMIQFKGLTRATFLNGQSVAVASVSSGNFTARFNHANYTNTPDNGTVSVLTNLWQIAGYTDIHNTVHGSGGGGLIDPYGCLFGTKSFSSTSQDGYVTTGTVSGVNSNGQYTLTVTVTTPSGTVLSSGPMEALLSDGFLVTQNSTSTATDTNGNQISVTNPSTPSWRLAYTDSTGNNILNATTTLNGNGVAAGATYSYTGPNNATETVTVTSTTPSIHTDFGCSAIFEYSNGTYPLVNQISLPDGSSYQIGYDTNGRISSVTLPAGGTVSYNYNGPNNGMMCQDGGSSGFTRTTPDGTWTYARSYSTTTGVWTTTVTDPRGNNTVYTFSGPLALTWVQGSFPNYTLTTIVQPEYEVQRQVYQLVNGQQVLMKTMLTCYNGNFTNCATATVTAPITQTDRYTYLPGVTNPSLSEAKYNNSELFAEDKEFDFNAALPPGSNQVSDRVIQYGTYSSGSCAAIGKNLLNRPCTYTTTGGGSTLSQTTYQYDGNGNLLSLGSLVSGSTFLTQTFSYYPSGLINVATDVNGGTTTYTYGSCNNSFPTSVAMYVNAQLTLNRSMAWNCTGETPTSITDENNQTTTYSYVDPTTGYLDPYWRVVAVTDPLQNITHYTYSPTANEQSFPFNGNSSTVDVLSTADSQGRLILMQTKQSPTSSNYDTVVQSYDSDGRPATVGIPCTSTASRPCTSAVTTTAYDNLGRTTQVTDGGGGYVSYNYAPGGTFNNDVVVTVGPAPTGENTKRKQMEYDGLGRLTSVCELTSTSNGGGTCSQTATQTGYWTKYVHDGLNRLISVSQNAQSASPQSRTFSYDGLSRLTSETNPESGTATYTYDTDSTCGTSKGDLVKKIDSVGNVTCFASDALHRKLSATYPSGTYAGVTPSKYFVYDSATLNGTAMTNVKDHLAEAYTCTTCPGTKLTDIGYSYTARRHLGCL